MKERLLAVAGYRLAALVAVAISMVVALTWYDFQAVDEWRRSAIALANRAAYESAVLMVTALTRDMRGAQLHVLADRDAGDLTTQRRSESSRLVATAFTRFPYPESFFVWQNGDDDLLFFYRANREPTWALGRSDSRLHSVVVVRNAPFGASLLAQLKRDALIRNSYTYVHTTLGEETYQIVARLEYSDPFRDELNKITGFMVNLSWVRTQYFPEIVAQVARIGQSSVTLDHAILDEKGMPVVGTVAPEPATSFDLPLQFFDPWTTNVSQLRSTVPVVWKVRVSAANDPTVIAATRGADWTMLAIASTALILVLSFFLIAHAIQASASLAAMRADFVTTVTHNLKTPLSTIRMVADTMMRQQLDPGTIRKYTATLIEESRRLSRLVDNSLAYARVTDVTEIYSFEQVDPAELIEDTLTGFRQQLSDGGFDVEMKIPYDLPMIRGDRTALRLMLDNLIDNAIRYSGRDGWIAVSAYRLDSRVIIEVRDRGVGIPPTEIDAVQRKFVRGSRTRTSGTGLGLTIVTRIVHDHSGHFELSSEVGTGTTATLELPVS